MKATIISFRRGRHTQTTNQFLLELPGVDNRAMASQFIGRGVIWKSTAGKMIHGKIAQTHGNNGLVRARFNKGLPGTAITNQIEVLEKHTERHSEKTEKAVNPTKTTKTKK